MMQEFKIGGYQFIFFSRAPIYSFEVLEMLEKEQIMPHFAQVAASLVHFYLWCKYAVWFVPPPSNIFSLPGCSFCTLESYSTKYTTHLLHILAIYFFIFYNFLVNKGSFK